MNKIFLLLLILVLGVYALDFYPYVSYGYFDRHLSFDSRPYGGGDYLHSRLTYPNASRDIVAGFVFEHDFLFLGFSRKIRSDSDVIDGFDWDYLKNGLYFESLHKTHFKTSDFNLKFGGGTDNWKVYLRYIKSVYNITMTDLRLNFYNYKFVNGRRIPNLNSTYNVFGRNIVFGVSSKRDFVKYLDLFGVFEFSPRYALDSRGYWNLRELYFSHFFRRLSYVNLQLGCNFVYDFLEVSLCYVYGQIWGNGDNISWSDYGSNYFTRRKWPIYFEYKHTGLTLLLKLCI